MTDDFAARVTLALRNAPHTTACDSRHGDDYGCALLCNCDRSVRVGGLVARAIGEVQNDMLVVYGESEKIPMTMHLRAQKVGEAAALRVLEGAE